MACYSYCFKNGNWKAIDKNLKEKGIRADYAYILIERLKSKHLEEEPMTYGISRDKKIAEKLSLDISHLNGG